MTHLRQGALRNAKLQFLFFLFAVSLVYSVTVAPAAAQQADADVLVAEAVLLYEEKRYDDALDLLKRAQASDPENVRGLYYLGLTHLALKQPDLAIAPLETADQLQPGDANIHYQLAIAYFTEGRFGQAAPLFEDLYKANPDRENLGYYVGFDRYRNKEYQAAVDTFGKAKITDPNLVQLAHFYRGLALSILGFSAEAAGEIKAAQQTQVISPITGAALLRFGDVIAAGRATEPERRLRAQVSVGGYYDTNVAYNPTSTTIPPVSALAVQNQQIVDSLRNRPTESPGALFNAFLEYAFWRTPSYEASVSYGLTQTFNTADTLSFYNMTNNDVTSNVYYRGAPLNIPIQFGLHYTYGYLLLNGNGFFQLNSPWASLDVVGPTTTLPLIGKLAHLTNFIGRYQIKTYFQEANNDPRFQSELRDGYNYTIGLVHNFRFSDDRFTLRTGYMFDNEDTTGSSFAYTGNRLQTGAQAALGWGLTARFDYDAWWRSYKNSQTQFVNDQGFLGARQDFMQQYFAQLSKQLSNNFSLAFQYQRTIQDSNIPTYTFTKSVYTVLVTWTY